MERASVWKGVDGCVDVEKGRNWVRMGNTDLWSWKKAGFTQEPRASEWEVMPELK